MHNSLDYPLGRYEDSEVRLHIDTLTSKLVKQAGELADSVFSHVPGIKPSESISGYLNDALYASLYPDRTMKRHFWVATEDNAENRNIVGTVGIYELKIDANDASYVGWICVSKDARSNGIGKQLLEKVIAEARAQEKKFVRLDTSTHPKEAAAVAMYTQYGFSVIKSNGSDTGPDGITCELLDMELKLQ